MASHITSNAKIPNILSHTLLTGLKRQCDTVDMAVDWVSKDLCSNLSSSSLTGYEIFTKSFPLSLVTSCTGPSDLTGFYLVGMSGGHQMAVYTLWKPQKVTWLNLFVIIIFGMFSAMHACWRSYKLQLPCLEILTLKKLTFNERKKKLC